MTKKYLLCVLAVAFLLCPGKAFADTFLSSLQEEADRFIYAQGSNEKSGIVVTVCDMQGRELKSDELRNAGKSVVFYQSPDATVSLYIHDESGTGTRFSTASFTTRNKNLAFAGGIKIGDPVSKAVNSGVMEGQYFEQAQNGVTVHMWITPDYSSGFISADGRITDVMFLNNYVIQQTHLREDLTAYIDAPQPAAPKGGSGAGSKDGTIWDKYL